MNANQIKYLLALCLIFTISPNYLPAVEIEQVGVFDTWQDPDGGTIQSTDPAGVTFHGPSGHLVISDSEINELPEFNGVNIFEVSTSGDLLFNTYDSVAATNNDREPTGITFNAFDGFFYVTNDNVKEVLRYDSNFRHPLAAIRTTDDVESATDPEGITSDPTNGFLYVLSCTAGRQVLAYDPHLNFQYQFGVAASAVLDPEGIAFDPISHHLFMVSSVRNNITEYSLTGALVATYGISGFNPQPIAAQGLGFGPSSDPDDDPSDFSLYIADGMNDNFPDGRVYEARINRATLIIPDQFATVAEAVAAAEEGDLILIEPGVYTEPDVISVNKSITIASRYLIENDETYIENTVLTGDPNWNLFHITNGSVVTLVGLTMENVQRAIEIVDGDVTIRNNVIRNTTLDGISFEENSSGLVENCIISTSLQDDGIDIDGAKGPYIIRNNSIIDNWNDGIEIRLLDQYLTDENIEYHIHNNQISGAISGDGIQLIDYSSDTLNRRVFFISNNVIQNNHFAGVGTLPEGLTGRYGLPVPYPDVEMQERVFVSNNTIIGNDVGISGGNNFTVLNNIIAAHDVGVTHVDGSDESMSILDFTMFWDNDTDMDDVPVENQGNNILFADPQLDIDNQLTADSPAIDAGTDNYIWEIAEVLNINEFIGNAPDLGAFESDFLPDPGPIGVRIELDPTVAWDQFILKIENTSSTASINQVEITSLSAAVFDVLKSDGSFNVLPDPAGQNDGLAFQNVILSFTGSGLAPGESVTTGPGGNDLDGGNLTGFDVRITFSNGDIVTGTLVDAGDSDDGNPEFWVFDYLPDPNPGVLGVRVELDPTVPWDQFIFKIENTSNMASINQVEITSLSAAVFDVLMSDGSFNVLPDPAGQNDGLAFQTVTLSFTGFGLAPGESVTTGPAGNDLDGANLTGFDVRITFSSGDIVTGTLVDAGDSDDGNPEFWMFDYLPDPNPGVIGVRAELDPTVPWDQFIFKIENTSNMASINQVEITSLSAAVFDVLKSDGSFNVLPDPAGQNDGLAFQTVTLSFTGFGLAPGESVTTGPAGNDLDGGNLTGFDVRITFSNGDIVTGTLVDAGDSDDGNPEFWEFEN